MFREYFELNYNKQLGITAKDKRKPYLLDFEQLFSDFEDLCICWQDILEKCTDDNLLVSIFNSINANWFNNANTCKPKGNKTIQNKLSAIKTWVDSFSPPITSICYYKVKNKSTSLDNWYEEGEIIK